MPARPPFSGAKIALLCRGRLLAYQRDDKPDIPWPGLWDLPGGGREHGETPFECAARETREEFDLTLDPAWVTWTRVYPGLGANGLDTWFFVAQVPDGLFDQVTFGDEGQRWQVMEAQAFLQMDAAVVHLQQRLQAFFEDSEGT